MSSFEVLPRAPGEALDAWLARNREQLLDPSEAVEAGELEERFGEQMAIVDAALAAIDVRLDALEGP